MNNPTGIEAFNANVERMRALGAANRARRQEEASRNNQEHSQRMQNRAKEAIDLRQARQDVGLNRRNAHNEKLRRERAERLNRENQIKLRSVGR